MSETYALVDNEVDRIVEAEDLTVSEASMRVMVTSAMAMAFALPRELRGVLVAACSRWFGGLSAADRPLGELAADCWAYLEEKHGNTTTVTDRGDVAVRTLLCVLWDKAPDSEELDSTLDYFVPLLDQFEGAREAIGLVQ